MARIMSPSLNGFGGFSSAHFDFGNLSERVKLWYNGK